MLDFINNNIKEVLVNRQLAVNQKRAIEEEIKKIDVYLQSVLIEKLNYGTNRANVDNFDIKIIREKDVPAISSKVTGDVVQEIHQRINAPEAFVQYTPSIITAAFNRLTLAQRNQVADVVYYRAVSPKIEVMGVNTHAK